MFVQARRDLRSQVVDRGPACGDDQNCQNHQHGDARPHALRFIRRIGDDARIRSALGLQRVFGHQIVFIESQIARDRADEAAIENTAGQLLPLFVFECFEEARRNACGDGNFFQ